MIAGLDLHAGYGRIDFKLAAAAGYRFAYCKGPEGNEPARDDLTWRLNVDGAQANGMAAGVYMVPWYLPHGDGRPAGRHPVEQAERFFQRLGGFGSEKGTLPPAIDIEWPPPEEWAKWGCTAKQISAWLKEHVEAVERLWRRAPVIYVYPHHWRELARGSDVSWARRYRLWWADYGWSVAGTPPDGWVPPHWRWQSTWSDWAICQHSAKGSLVRVPGVQACPVDRNVILDEATLDALLGLDVDAPEPRIQPGPQPIVHVLPDTLDPCEHCHRQSCGGECIRAGR